MKKLLLSFLAFVVPFMVLAGNRITQQQAMQIAGEFLNSSRIRMATSPKSPSNLKMVKKTVGEEYFICSDEMNHSFVIVSGDDAVGPVLAYSTENAFGTENMPENVKFYLKMLEGEVRYYRAHPNAVPSNPNMDDDTEKVLETAKWDQSAPYYNFTPMDGGQHAVTGCVATAMAIVMRYHNWPDCGVGTIPAYTTPKGAKVEAIELGYPYDWSNMLMEYKSGRWTETEGNAVARLMADCGAAVQMQYSASGSGAFSQDVAPALTTYFKYDKSIRFMYRDGCTKAQWVKFIHDDIDNNRPLIFGAQSTSGGGHEFVGAGYRGNDYVFINFGWGGSSNGFYYVTTMDDFSLGVDAIFNIKPDEGGSPAQEIRLGLGTDLTLTAPYVQGQSFGVTATWYNFGTISFTGKTGAGIRGVDNKLRSMVSKSHSSINPNSGYRGSYSFSAGTIVKAGEQVQLYYQPEGQTGWTKMNFYEDDVKGIVYPAGQKENFMQFVKFSYDKSTKTMSFILPYNDIVDESTGATEFVWKLKDKDGNVVSSAVTYDNLVISIATGSLSAGKYTLELSYWDVTKSITLPIDNSVE